MLRKVFSVFDDKSEAYLQPFFMETEGQARRAISDCVNDPGHQFSKHPADYTLFYICDFDDSVGQFVYYNEPNKGLGNLLTFKQEKIDDEI